MSTESATTTAEPTGTLTITHTLVDDQLGEITVDREVALADCFGDNGRLILWSDAYGHNGAVYENGQLYRYNRIRGNDEPVEKKPISMADLRDMLESHISNKHAGGVGTFATGCCPP